MSFQIGLSLEIQVRGKAVTISTGCGYLTTPWWGNLFAIIAQGAVGVRRFGLILLGTFLTAQFVDLDGVRASMLGEQIKKQKSSVPGGKNIAPGAVKGKN